MKNKLLFVVALFLLVFVANKSKGQNQGINNNWLMGYDSEWGLPWGISRINFFLGAPVINYDSLEMEFRHTHSNISDAQGNLLFYTNGYYIADASNDTMQNGSGINPSPFTSNFPQGLTIPQANVILPKPGSNHEYFLIHSTIDNYPAISCSNNLYLSVIDMSLNGGLGAVTIKNQILFTDSMNYGKIAACKHANGRDWWIICQRINSNTFFKFLITPTGILGPYSQNIGISRLGGAGQIYFSPDGNKLGQFWINSNNAGNLEIFDFDRCAAMLSNPVHINLPYELGYNVGVAFSSNSNVLYVSNISHIYQFDLTAGNIAASQTIVAVYDSFLSVVPGFPPLPTNFSLCSLAPDGKIYITTGNSTYYLHTIDNPDILGMGCNVNQHSVLLPALYYNTLPNHPNYFLECDTTGGCTACYTGIKTLNKNEINLIAAPNPNNGIFTLQFPVQKISGELEVFDVMGNMVLKDYVAPWSQYKHVDITKLSNGIYFCKMKWKDNSGSVKIIKE